MARLPRVIAVDGPHHVTQRGNARRFILDSDTDRNIYLELLKQSLALHDVTMMGYCLMSNHVHLVLVPRRAESLGLALKHAHGRYASYWNAIHHSGGQCGRAATIHVRWTSRICGKRLHYTELNPIRAGLVAESKSWMWSSTAAHCAAGSAPGWLALELWQSHWRRRLGESFSVPRKMLPRSPQSVCRRTPDARSGLRNSSMRWNDRRNGPCRRKKRGRRPRAVADPRQIVLSLNA